MTKKRLNVLVLGGCRLRQSSRSVAKTQDRVDFEPCGPVNGTNTPGEMLRTIAFLQRDLVIPPELWTICHMLRGVAPLEEGKDFSHLDAALLEISTPVELVFRGFFLSLYRFRRQVLMPLQSAGVNNQLVSDWFRALKEFDEVGRAKASLELVKHLPENLEQRELIQSFILETRSRKANIAKGLEQIRDQLGCQIGIVRYIFRYMPDGRQVDWPPGFLAEVDDAARQLGVPTYDPTPTLLKFGVDKAFRPDQEFHYVRELLPVMGDDLVGFAESICGTGAARSSKTDEPIPA